jgi:ribose 5-phosphate isomerase B
MRIGIATDHGGFDLKEELLKQLREAGHEVVDFGAHGLNQGDDYPDYVVPLAEAVAAEKVDRGVAICGSGVGASVCANKIRGIRAALIHDHFSARQGVEDDQMNILCMGGRTDRRTIRRLGPCPALSRGRVQSSTATFASLKQSGLLGGRRLADVRVHQWR